MLAWGPQEGTPIALEPQRGTPPRRRGCLEDQAGRVEVDSIAFVSDFRAPIAHRLICKGFTGRFG